MVFCATPYAILTPNILMFQVILLTAQTAVFLESISHLISFLSLCTLQDRDFLLVLLHERREGTSACELLII